MNVKRILLFAGMALAAMALTAPAVAQGEVELTEGGEAIEIGKEITATSTDYEVATSTGTYECEEVTLQFIVEENGPEVMLDPSEEAVTENCVLDSSSGKFPLTFTKKKILGPLKFIKRFGVIISWIAKALSTDIYLSKHSHVTNQPLTICDLFILFEAIRSAINGDEITVGSSTSFGLGAGCPASGTVSATFTLETSNGTPVVIE